MDHWEEALGRGKISDEEFMRFQGYWGFSDDYFNLFKALAARPISPFIIRYIAEAEIVDPEMIYEICIDSGYSEEHAQYLARAFTLAAVSGYRRGLETVLLRCYREGYILREVMEEELELAWELADRRSLILKRADWEFFADSMSDKLRIYQESFRRGIITEEIFVHDLEEMGFEPLRVKDYLERERIRKLGRR